MPTECEACEQRLLGGDPDALSEILVKHQDRLRRMVELRLDRRLQGRVDAWDVLQDAFLEATTRIEEYVRTRPMPLFLWLRFLVAQRLMTLHRFHLGTAKRDANREISIYYAPIPEASSAMLAAQLVGSLTAPSQALLRSERKLKLQEALNQLEPADREIIALRNLEQLTREETAVELQIRPEAAGKRYIRAIRRLRDRYETIAGEPASRTSRGECGQS